jgi:hypothetical protein
MNECIICNEEIKDNTTLCINCLDKHNVVIIGNKHPAFYLYKIVCMGEHHNSIVVQCLWDKIEIVNRIIRPILYYWGLQELRRYTKKENGKNREIQVYYIVFEMISPLKGLKTDAKRKGFL